MDTKLGQRLEKIKKVFAIETLLSIRSDTKYIQKYYRVNKIPYSIFHTSSDLIYMGISRDGIFKEEDLLEAARMVDTYIKELQATKVLELATGRGANSLYLARRHPETEFHGIDISQAQLVRAEEKARKAKNYHPMYGDYHDLSQFPDSSFDILFIVEALCYSQQKEEVLAEAHRVLKENGVLIIFDGYREQKENMSKEERLSRELTEKAMALNQFDYFDSFSTQISRSRFLLEKEENVSKYVLPTMKKFERLAERFFAHPFSARCIRVIFPKEFTYNAIAGYLMVPLFESRVFSYRILVLRK